MYTYLCILSAMLMSDDAQAAGEAFSDRRPDSRLLRGVVFILFIAALCGPVIYLTGAHGVVT